jgi:hypothetical protein
VGREQSAPPMGQTGQLTARQRQQGPIIGVAYQLLEHVEPLPHCLPEDLTQNLVHLANLPAVQAVYLMIMSATRGPGRDQLNLRTVRAGLNPSCAVLRRRAML